MTTLLIFMFETGDSSCPYWIVPTVVQGPYVAGTLETKTRIYMDDNPYADYEEAAALILDDAGVRWEPVARKIPECDRLDVLIV